MTSSNQCERGTDNVRPPPQSVSISGLSDSDPSQSISSDGSLDSDLNRSSTHPTVQLPFQSTVATKCHHHTISIKDSNPNQPSQTLSSKRHKPLSIFKRIIIGLDCMIAIAAPVCFIALGGNSNITDDFIRASVCILLSINIFTAISDAIDIVANSLFTIHKWMSACWYGDMVYWMTLIFSSIFFCIASGFVMSLGSGSIGSPVYIMWLITVGRIAILVVPFIIYGVVIFILYLCSACECDDSKDCCCDM